MSKPMNDQDKIDEQLGYELTSLAKTAFLLGKLDSKTGLEYAVKAHKTRCQALITEARLDEALFIRYNAPINITKDNWIGKRIGQLQNNGEQMSKTVLLPKGKIRRWFFTNCSCSNCQAERLEGKK